MIAGPTITDGLSLTKANEGCRLAAYYDDEGECWTIGYGHVGPDACHGAVWTQEQCDNQFAIDYARARAEARRALGSDEWAALDAPRQAVLADMGFQVGGAGLGKFIHLLDAMRAGNWALAGAALKNSALFREAPRREATNLRILLTGQWPDAPLLPAVPLPSPAAPRSVALPLVAPCIPEPPRGLWGAILALLGRA